MKAKVIVSLGAVIGLAALSAAAFWGMVAVEPANLVTEGVAVPGTVTVSVVPEMIPKESECLPEPFPADEPGREPEWPEKDSGRRGESYLLAKIAMAEAEGEDTEGKALVMLVVLNRVQADGFPDTVEGVIYEENQFSPIANGRFGNVEPDADCWRALSMVESGWDQSLGATFFESDGDSTWHEENLDYLFRHGSHYFYTSKERAE